MRVAIIIRSGPHSGQRFVLKSGQLATVGRSSWNDFSFPSDDLMQESEFSIICGRDSVYLQDINPSELTTLNGIVVASGSRITVQHNAIIQAGRTELMFLIEGATSSELSHKLVAPEEKAQAVSTEVLVSRAEYLELSEETLELIKTCTTAQEVETKLESAGAWDDIITWKGFHCDRVALVRWFYDLLSRPDLDVTESSQQASAVEAMNAIQQWLIAASEENRDCVERIAIRMKRKGPIGSLLSGIAWSGGSLTRPPLEPILPDARLTSRCVSTGAKLLAHQCLFHKRAFTFKNWVNLMPVPDYQNIHSKL